MRNTMFNEIKTYGESEHTRTSLRNVENKEHIQAANITSAQMRRTMAAGLSPRHSGNKLGGASPLNASGRGRNSTHKSPNSKR